MNEAFLKELRGLEFDSLSARDAVELRGALNDALRKSDAWFQQLSNDFQMGTYPKVSEELAKVIKGRPPDNPPPSVQPVKTPPARKRRGRPVPQLQVDFKGKPKPPPIKVGGADAEQDGPQPARIFQDSYVSKDGPQAGAELPEGHPRRHLMRESSVTPEVDMSDFAEVEAALKSGKKVTDVFQ